MRLHALFVLIALALVSPVVVVAQAAAANPLEQDQVSVSVFITDANGKPITAINEGDLSIEDNHKPPVTVIGIHHDTSPLRLGVLIDSSNSQSHSKMYKPAVESLSEFVRQVLPRDVDKTFVETFGTAPEQPTPWMNVDEFQNIGFKLHPSGGTSLYDAIDLACRERFANDPSPTRRVLVLLSDGGENMSRTSMEAAIETAQRAKVAIITISTEEIQTLRGSIILKNLTSNTGGYAFLDSGQLGLPQQFSQAANLLNSMFQVVYVPAQAPTTGKAHQLQIKPASGKKLRIQAPKRYYAATP